jgi:hypothetical protein
MIPQKILALFDFIDFLDNNKAEYINKYIPLCDEFKILYEQKSKLRPHENYKDKQQYDNLQIQIKEKRSKIIENVYDPITKKLRDLEIWSGDVVATSIWNRNLSAIVDFKENFSKNDISQVMLYKQKYLTFRTEINIDFYDLSHIFSNLDEILKELFDFFKDTDKNEFERFETKEIEVSNIKEAVKKFIENREKNVKFSIPVQELQRQTNAKTHEIIMGDKIMRDKIETGDINNNSSGQVSIGGKGNKIEADGKDNLSKKSYYWQKWGVIVAVIGVVVTIIIAIFM